MGRRKEHPPWDQNGNKPTLGSERNKPTMGELAGGTPPWEN